ncbi:MAG: recombination protein RecR [Pelagibacterales bacterium]|nr:recombination protein RecR [Pelagibacterales bacterium]PPR15698.1 MAG: Recombination protein RecR [Alphaproteobacteria bacterium MarineAlpha9_Bin3]|tara:strand:- start:3393 stop:3995 length:603 start_codon:yes stop_codon:yes gene_type:complete
MESQEIKNLIKLMAKIPGLGPRSARRSVLSLIKNPEKLMLPLAKSLIQVSENIKLCSICGNIDSDVICGICKDEKRDKNTICVVEDITDVWALERSNTYKGKYHILGGVLSAIDGINPEDLRVKELIDNIKINNIKEVILATSATLAGQTTSFYITDLLKDMNLTVSRLAQGIPIGAELDYLDDGTIGAALDSRKILNKK